MEVSKKALNITVVLMTLVLAVGTVIGSIYLMKSKAVTDTELENYLSQYISNAQNGINKTEALKKSLIQNVPYLLMVFASGFFKGGVLLVGYAIMKKGFIIGFTSAACIKFFGGGGVLVTTAMLPGLLLMIPSFLIFSSISTDFAINSKNRKKNFVFFYIFLSLIMLTIFCVAAACEGYLTTIFMKWLSPKLMK